MIRTFWISLLLTRLLVNPLCQLLLSLREVLIMSSHEDQNVLYLLRAQRLVTAIEKNRTKGVECIEMSSHKQRLSYLKTATPSLFTEPSAFCILPLEATNSNPD